MILCRFPYYQQQEYIDQWREKNVPVELLRYAYEKTIEQIDKLNFEYIAKIILSWTASGFKTISDVKAAESEYKKKKKSTGSSSSDGGFDEEKYKFVINNF